MTGGAEAVPVEALQALVDEWRSFEADTVVAQGLDHAADELEAVIADHDNE